ncbi:SDR family oxidoreductase [Candidatus Neptunochlamydia vexilliferae]|uniref:SDR family oxidoreductase n=1 Tax=Candidatus Neptunichlamydia vexilliferae TaxID=1651774 RepID=UPI001890F074|nr:SDR family oxidoreductase [Candidatus Neptunochlamydia vexilliferae]
MKRVLVVGANGYIGTRLIPLLLEEGHEVIAVARRPESIRPSKAQAIQGDLLKKESLEALPKEIDVAYYLVHSMAHKYEDFEVLDKRAAENFVSYINTTSCKQVIYLTGLITAIHLSKHLRSRLEVETILKGAKPPLTSLRSGIIIGSGSASFEIIRDLVEKLPIMVTPKWVYSLCQPIAVRDILAYLVKVIDHAGCMGQTLDVGGSDVLTYKEMLEGYAKMRKLHRLMIPVPFFSPHLSSYWLLLITSTNYYLARSLIDSVKNNAICSDDRIQKIIPQKCLNYQEAVTLALDKIAADQVESTWKDSWSSSGIAPPEDFEIPKFGCLSMGATIDFTGDPDEVFKRVQQMGDRKGWCFMNWAWRIRGLFDRAVGGVGMRKGRRSQADLKAGDVIDFWRVLHVNPEKRRLTLLAEMKLPGEAWLDFKIEKIEKGHRLTQTAIFRPQGVFGRLYWYAFYPVHLIMFPGMLKRLITPR